MNRRDKNRREESDRFLRQALVGFMGLVLRAGTSASELRAISAQCAQRAVEESSSNGREPGLDIHRLASILRSWHKETRYLSTDGYPSPLLLSGKTGLRSLIGAYYPPSKMGVVFNTLKRAGLIRRHGKSRWVPTEAHVRMATDSQETLDHVSEGVTRFLETVANNVNARSKRDLLFEQSCKVRRLPTSERGPFRAFVRQQAIAFLTAVDDWLEARVESGSRRRSKQRTCTAGVFTFAYIDPALKMTKARLSKRRR
jgi:hypothetical protein